MKVKSLINNNLKNSKLFNNSSIFCLKKSNRIGYSLSSILNVSMKNYTNNIQKFSFSSKNENDDDTHSDFKPKTKIEITDENVMSVIDEWIKNNEVVLFMKGTREMPRCGFSNYVVQILKFYNIKDFKVINILEDPIVREAVKKYSNWPTYPQLYVKGNLIGNINLRIIINEIN